jgi:hypothetical protein
MGGRVLTVYTNHVLGQAIGQPGSDRKLTQLTAEQANEAPKTCFPEANSALILVRTSNGFQRQVISFQFLPGRNFADRVFSRTGHRNVFVNVPARHRALYRLLKVGIYTFYPGYVFSSGNRPDRTG